MHPGGILAINVAARTISLLEDIVNDVKKAFSEGDAEEEILWKERIKDNVAEDTLHSNNSGSRNSSHEKGAIEWNRSVVYLLKASDETANTTLLVIKGSVKVQSSQESALKAPVGKKKATRSPAADMNEASCKTNREDIIQDWLAVSWRQ